jgi:hypothetical protein
MKCIFFPFPFPFFLILNSLEKMLKMTRIRLEHIFWVFVFFVLAIFEFFSKDEVKN